MFSQKVMMKFKLSRCLWI